MWALLSSWVRRLLFFSVVVPLGAKVLRGVADAVERRRGESRTARLLRAGADQAQGLGRGRRRRRRRRR